jgi:hypothetical protein
VLGRGHRNAVGGNDLRLEREDVAALRVDQRLDPVNVVRVPLRVRREGVITEVSTRVKLSTRRPFESRSGLSTMK